MSKVEFTKPAKSFEEQLQLLIDRGLIVADQDSAIHALSHINYYRLSAYWIPLLTSREENTFQDGTTFNDILNLYIFDRELRLLVLDAIERVEISFRTQWAHQLSLKYGPHAYFADSRGMRKRDTWLRSNKQDLLEHLNRSDEMFVAHYRHAYKEELPPAWVSCEVMSLGLLSRWFSNLNAYPARTAIANAYSLNEAVLEGVMEHLTYIRNLCAHHSRLWNRRLTKLMPLPRTKPTGLRDDMTDGEDRKIYNTLVMIAHLMDVICIDHHWKQRLVKLIAQYDIDVSGMGFPDDWLAMPVWSSNIERKGA